MRIFNNISYEWEEIMEGTHGYSGSCAPGSEMPGKTFSVGIFKWVRKSSGNGYKKSAVIYRVSGSIKEAGKVYSRAELICSMMDEGNWTSTKKSETVK